jgi:nicotinamidase-related amidase
MTALQVDLSLPELQHVTIDPADSALVIVDMENEFMRPAGDHYLKGRAERAMGNLAPLLARFRAASGNVIYVQSLRARTGSEFTVYGQPHHLIEDTWAVEIAEELAPMPGEAIVKKRSNDSFNHTQMASVLSALGLVPGRSQLVVTGCATDGCVDCAVVGFSVRNYAVSVPEDCTASFSEEAEMFGYHHYFSEAYRHNVTPTRSDLITIKAP